MPTGQTRSSGVGLIGERVAHLKGSEDPVLDVGLVGLSADLLHDEPEHVVVRVGVLKHQTSAVLDLSVVQGPHPLVEGIVTHIVAEHRLVRGALRQTAGVVEQVAHRDRGRRRRIPHPEGGKVGDHRGVQVHRPVLDQLHDRQGGEGLGRGSEDERGLRGNHPPGSISHPKALKVHDLVLMDDAESQAGNAHLAPLPVKVGVDRDEVRTSGR